LSNICSNDSDREPAQSGAIFEKEFAVTTTVDTLPAELVPTDFDTPDITPAPAETASPEPTPAPDTAAAEAAAEQKPRKVPAKKAAPKKTKTLELTLTVTGTADGDWRAELKQGSTYLARNLAVAAAAVSRAAKELHEDLSSRQPGSPRSRPSSKRPARFSPTWTDIAKRRTRVPNARSPHGAVVLRLRALGRER
jgi:uncharacterized protein DUF6319